MGTAYRTSAVPRAFAADSTAIFAVYPPAMYGREFESTTYLLVTSSRAAGDAVVYPCTADGLVLSFMAVGMAAVRNHAAGLRAAGYELELVMPRGA